VTRVRVDREFDVNAFLFAGVDPSLGPRNLDDRIFAP
jgi:hypothetical protein